VKPPRARRELRGQRRDRGHCNLRRAALGGSLSSGAPPRREASRRARVNPLRNDRTIVAHVGRGARHRRWLNQSLEARARSMHVRRMKQRRWKELLEQRRAELLAAGDAPIEPNRKDVSAVGVADEDEQALSEMLQSLASARNQESAHKLAEIDRALARLRDRPDEFGECEDCGDPIPEKRLVLMPWARYCAECQARVDPRRNVARTKVTDYK
jgi:DnaK suppressor protein